MSGSACAGCLGQSAGDRAGKRVPRRGCKEIRSWPGGGRSACVHQLLLRRRRRRCGGGKSRIHIIAGARFHTLLCFGDRIQILSLGETSGAPTMGLE